MTTYYHVAPASYNGGDLLSFDEQEARGWEPVWKWECDYADTDVVCLHDNIDDAQEYIEVFQPDGKLLRIEIDDDDDRVSWTRVSEGYRAIYRRIPAEYIQEV